MRYLKRFFLILFSINGHISNDHHRVFNFYNILHDLVKNQVFKHNL